ncbi:unnamed protein product, partial [marine sediment metagenome]
NTTPDQCEYTETHLCVDVNATGSNTGKDWTNALTDLQIALCLADNLETVQEVWVAEGTYYPTDDGDREKTFSLVDGVKIYGGFAGTESTLADRNWPAHPTILSGDIGVAGDLTDNSYHVVTSNYNVEGYLDGFTITDGYAIHEKFFYGGGIYVSRSSPTLVNCKIMGNYAQGSGGGLFFEYTSYPTLLNCEIVGNTADEGGGIHIPNRGAHPTLINCTISGNSATTTGGGIYGIKDP